jgi:hypothetical protein
MLFTSAFIISNLLGASYLKLHKLVGILLLLTLSGCNGLPSKTSDLKEKEITEYNKLVSATLNAYMSESLNADRSKSDLLLLLTKDKELSLPPSVKLPQVLSPEESVAFNTYGVIYDKYFTSVGADAVREVLVLRGNGYSMFATVIWGKGEIQSLSRVVKEL